MRWFYRMHMLENFDAQTIGDEVIAVADVKNDPPAEVFEVDLARLENEAWQRGFEAGRLEIKKERFFQAMATRDALRSEISEKLANLLDHERQAREAAVRKAADVILKSVMAFFPTLVSEISPGEAICFLEKYLLSDDNFSVEINANAKTLKEIMSRPWGGKKIGLVPAVDNTLCDGDFSIKGGDVIIRRECSEFIKNIESILRKVK